MRWPGKKGGSDVSDESLHNIKPMDLEANAEAMQATVE
jgi:hypothetical protein